MRFDILYRLLKRLSGGFVIAVHDMPPHQIAEFVEGISPGRLAPLAELVQRTRAGKSSVGLFAVTVDDGAGDNVRALSQLFGARGWPITFYLPTQYLETGEPMSFQSWARLKPLLPRKRLTLNSGTIDFSRRGTIEALERMWYCQRLESYVPLIRELSEIIARETGLTKAELQGPAPITWQEVAKLSRNDLFRFESHGVSHAAMSALTEEQIVFEMQHSQQTVESHTGRPCRHLAYPFGSPLSIGKLAPQVARRFYDSAVTMTLGSVDRTDPWLLPRIPLYPENPLWFARMKVLLTCAGAPRAVNRAQGREVNALAEANSVGRRAKGAVRH